MYIKTCFMDRSKERGKKNRHKEAMIVIERIVKAMKKREVKRSKA